MPKDRQIKLMLAGQLADTGKYDEGMTMAKSLLNGSPEDRETYLQSPRSTPPAPLEGSRRVR